MILNYEKEGWHHLAVKKLSTLLRGITSKHPSDFFVWIVFILLEQKINLNLIKEYLKINIFVELSCY